MKTAEALKLVLGSVVVYGIVAACSATDGSMTGPSGSSGSTTATSGTASGASRSASAGTGGGSGPDGSEGNSDGSPDMTSLFDALTDPVFEAKADITTSGTRLKANYFVGTDGSKQFQSWHDSQLNLDCNFLTSTVDGTTRCLPVSAGSFIGYYTDPQCSQKLVAATTCSPGLYLTVYETGTSTCVPTSVAHVFAPGSQYTGATVFVMTTVYSPDAGANVPACVSTSAATTLTYYTLGAEVPMSTFVQATIQTDP